MDNAKLLEHLSDAVTYDTVMSKDHLSTCDQSANRDVCCAQNMRDIFALGFFKYTENYYEDYAKFAEFLSVWTDPKYRVMHRPNSCKSEDLRFIATRRGASHDTYKKCVLKKFAVDTLKQHKLG